MLRYEYKGEMKTIRELADIAGISYNTMHARLDFCKTVEEALSPSLFKMFEYKGGMYTIRQLAEMAGVSYARMRERLTKMSAAEALDFSARKNSNKEKKIEAYKSFLIKNGYKVEKIEG